MPAFPQPRADYASHAALSACIRDDRGNLALGRRRRALLQRSDFFEDGLSSRLYFASGSMLSTATTRPRLPPSRHAAPSAASSSVSSYARKNISLRAPERRSSSLSYGLSQSRFSPPPPARALIGAGYRRERSGVVRESGDGAAYREGRKAEMRYPATIPRYPVYPHHASDAVNIIAPAPYSWTSSFLRCGRTTLHIRRIQTMRRTLSSRTVRTYNSNFFPFPFCSLDLSVSHHLSSDRMPSLAPGRLHIAACLPLIS
jgi:hypothetical protein